MRYRDGFGTVKALLIEQPLGRSVLRTALNSLEIASIEEWTEVRTDPADLEALASFDLIIGNIDDGDLAVAGLLRGLRTGAIPGNPFVPAIITCGSGMAATVRAAVDAGADAVVLKPYSLSGIMEPVAALVDRRRPFVVTADYIGPERRATPRPGQAVGQLDVPNRLAAKVLRLDVGSQIAAEAQAWAVIERQRTHRLVFQALFLVRLARVVRENDAVAAARRELARLPALARELAARLKTPADQPYLRPFTHWIGIYPGLSDEAERQASCDVATDALVALLVQFDGAEDPDATITHADAAVSSYCRKLSAA